MNVIVFHAVEEQYPVEEEPPMNYQPPPIDPHNISLSDLITSDTFNFFQVCGKRGGMTISFKYFQFSIFRYFIGLNIQYETVAH